MCLISCPVRLTGKCSHKNASNLPSLRHQQALKIVRHDEFLVIKRTFMFVDA